MAILCNKMKKRRTDLNIKSKDLKVSAEISQNVMAKTNKNELVSIGTLEKYVIG